MNFARDDASQHAMRAPAVKSPNRNPGGIAETPGFVAETPSDCRLRCRNPTLNGEGFGNAHRTMTQQARAFSAVEA